MSDQNDETKANQGDALAEQVRRDIEALNHAKKYTSVSELVRDIADKEFADEFDRAIAEKSPKDDHREDAK